MCRRSMGCVHYRWQLMFADTINNKTESYIDIIDWTWYIHVIIDSWHLIEYLTWHILYCLLSTLPLIYFIHVTSYPVYFYSSIVVICTHCFCTYTFPFYFTHWVNFWRPWICTSILDASFYCSSIRWDRRCCEELEFSSAHSGILVFLFIPVVSVWSTDPIVLPDHPHVLNVVALLYQCEQLWMVTDVCMAIVTPRFPKYVEAETRRDSVTYIRDEKYLTYTR